MSFYFRRRTGVNIRNIQLPAGTSLDPPTCRPKPEVWPSLWRIICALLSTFFTPRPFLDAFFMLGLP